MCGSDDELWFWEEMKGLTTKYCRSRGEYKKYNSTYIDTSNIITLIITVSHPKGMSAFCNKDAHRRFTYIIVI